MPRSPVRHLLPSALLNRLDPVNELDRRISDAVSRRPHARLDDGMKRLTATANHSVLWFAVAGLLATRSGPARRAAMRGVLSIAAASALANGVLKPLLPRRRPAASELPAYRLLPHPPTSSSFPSGHAASAAAFAVAVGCEDRRLGAAVVPLAATVAYSRVHVGVHWASDVLAGAAVGTAVALATRRWWPVRAFPEVRARPLEAIPPLPDGAGLVLLANEQSGSAGTDPAAELTAALPQARILTMQSGDDPVAALEDAVSGTGTRAIGAAGGDGTVTAAASVAARHGLPLMVVPAGTLNHFARDAGVDGVADAVRALTTGRAVAAGLAVVEAHPSGRIHPFLNTASIGSYPELVRLREQWQPRYGKWPAFAAALYVVLRRSEKVWVRVEDRWQQVWFLFVGNGRYHPHGMVPAFRPELDTGLLDVRWLRADLRWSRLRALGGLLLGALGHSRVYQETETTRLDVELREPSVLAADGEVVEEAGRYTFRVSPDPVPIYRDQRTGW